MKRLTNKELLIRKFKKFLYDNDALEEWNRKFSNKETRLTEKKQLFDLNPNMWITYSICWYSEIKTIDWCDIAILWDKVLNAEKTK